MAARPSTEASGPTVPRGGPLAWVIIVVGVAAAVGWVLLGQQLGETIQTESVTAAIVVYYGLLFVPLVMLALLLGYLGHIRVMRSGEAPARWMLAGAAAGTVGLFMTIAFAWANGGLVDGPEATMPAAMALLAVALTVLQVGTEELLFRGWLQPALVARTGAGAGIGLGALIFAAFHLSAGASAPVSLLNLFLGGVLFGLFAWRSGGLAAPFMAHFAWNAIEDIGLGLVPNPGTGPLGSLIDKDLAGSLLWGGHEEGLNASIGTTAVLIALILPLLFRRNLARTVTA